MSITGKFFGKLFILFLFVAGNINLTAQPSNQSVLSIGTKHGVNLSEIVFEPPVKQKIYPGYTGGLVIKYISQTHAGIQAEINYSQRGWSENLDSVAFYTRRLNYFELPILTQFIIGRNNTRAIINVGPNLSYLRSHNEDFRVLNAGDTLSYYMRTPDRKFEFGLVGGVGVCQTTAIGDFQLEARFHYGFQNVFFTDKNSDVSKSQNLLYSITLTYFFFKKDFRANSKK